MLKSRTALGVVLRKGFGRSVATLVGGTASAQVLMLLVLPILTRLYTPEHFSVLAAYASLLAILSVGACLRYEIAIPIPERHEDAANLLALSLISSVILSLIVTLGTWALGHQIITWLGQPALDGYLWLLPLGVWLASSYAALQYWSIRKKDFSIVARTRLTQAVGGASAQIGLGLAGFAPLGLLLGQIISNSSGILALLRSSVKFDRPAFASVNYPELKRTAKNYSRFPMYSTFEAFVNSAGAQLPVIVIASLAIGPEAGFLMLAMRAMQTPMGVIGGAVGQVYLSRASLEMREGNLGKFTGDVFEGLVKSGVGPLLFSGIVAPPFFAVVFGEEWRRAGQIVTWMTPWFVLQYLASPVSMVFHIRSKQRLMLLLVCFGLLVRVGAVAFAASHEPKLVTEYFAAGSMAFYLALFIMAYRLAGCEAYQLVRAFRDNLRLIILWSSAGLLIRLMTWSFYP